MANINYLKNSTGNSGSVYGDWKPRGALAGWHYQDKVDDFRTNQSLLQNSVRLDNTRVRQTNEDYALDAPRRELQRQGDIMGLPSENVTRQAEGEVAASISNEPSIQQNRIELAIFQAASDMDNAKKGEYLGKISGMAREMQALNIDMESADSKKVLEMFRSNQDQMGTREILDRWSSFTDEQLNLNLRRIAAADADVLDRLSKSALQERTETSTEGIQAAHDRARVEAAGKTSANSATGFNKEVLKEATELEARKIRAERKRAGNLDYDLSAYEEARLLMLRIHMDDPYMAGAGRERAKAEGKAAWRERLKGHPQKLPTGDLPREKGTAPRKKEGDSIKIPGYKGNAVVISIGEEGYVVEATSGDDEGRFTDVPF